MQKIEVFLYYVHGHKIDEAFIKNDEMSPAPFILISKVLIIVALQLFLKVKK